MDAHTTKILGSEVKYWIFNNDKPRTIVMVHGFRGTHRGLQDIVDALPDFRIVIPDLPGFGDSTPMTEQPHTMRGYAECIRQLIHKLKLKQVIILGHSMGTMIGAELVALEPRLVSRLVLVNPIAEHPLRGFGVIAMSPGVLYHWLGGKVLPEKIGHWLLSNKLLFLIGSATMTKTKDKQLRKKIHNNHITYMSKFHNRHTLLEAYYASMNTTVTEQVAHIKVPTLLIAGKVDTIAPIAGQRKLANLLEHSQLIELDNVGHIIHYEKPREAAQAIRKFLAS